MLIIYFSTFLVALVRPQRRNEDKMEPTKLKPKRGDPSTLNFGRNLFTHGSVRVPAESRLHPIIPQLYVPEWKTDMQNRELITKNAALGGVPNFEHDENLFLEKREQMFYNVEDRNRVDRKYTIPPRAKLLRPDFHSEMSRYQSELMFRRDADSI